MAGCCRGNQLHCRQSSGGCYCVCACASSGFQIPSPNSVPSMANDPLLLALVSRILQSSAPPPLGYQLIAEEIHGFQCPSQQRGRQKPDLRSQCQQHLQEEQEQPQQQANGLIRSLLRRIAALETAIPGVSSSPSPAEVLRSPRNDPKVSPPPPRRALLRDLAARTIQAAFRLYLVRRSRTLRDLKLLASIRSQVAVLRSSLSEEERVSPKILFQKVADLLRLLESIQSTDAMIREGKRPIGRELAQLLGFAESLLAQKTEAMNQRTFSGIERTGVEHFPDLFEAPLGETEESDEGSPNVRAFSTNAAKKGSRVSAIAGKSIIEEERSRIGIGERSQREADILFDWFVPDEATGRVYEESLSRKHTERRALPMEQDGCSSPGLSAPLPLQMEPRKGHTKKATVSIS